MESFEVRSALERALECLVREHAALFTADANERSITHWLASIIAPMFPTWHVDCEYNRVGAQPKRVVVPASDVPANDRDAQTVYPDIIVHRRNTDENLLVIEAKKAARVSAVVDDEQKLDAFVYTPTSGGGLGYRFGALVVLHTVEFPSANIAKWLERDAG